MKNSIFKSYTKKILRSEAFISVIIVFVLALGIIGTSYALYMDVDKDTDYQLVEAGDLKISFSGSNTITLNMLPQEDDVATNLSDNLFTFNIYNTGTYDADYKIKLVATTGSSYVSSEYINYQLCKTACTDTTPINTLNNITDSIIHADSITTTDEGHDYILRVWINNTYPGTTERTLQVKVVVEAQNQSIKSTLADTILNSANKAKENNDSERTQFYSLTDLLPTTPGKEVSNSTEKVLAMAEDGYTNQILENGDIGDYSYYFRGAVTDNYVEFNNMCWRIIRIEGDGSVKLALAKEGLCSSIKETDTGSALVAVANYGYTYNNYPDYENSIDSVSMKYQLDGWFNGNLSSGESRFSSSIKTKIKSSPICIGNLNAMYDRNGNKITQTDLDNSLATNGYYTIIFDNYLRIHNGTPSFICPENGNTVSSYQVSTVTMDEALYAGGHVGLSENKSYYLIENTDQIWWTTSPEFYDYDGTTGQYTSLVTVIDGDYGYVPSIVDGNYDTYVRPVISLLPDIEVEISGTGIITNPYVVK